MIRVMRNHQPEGEDFKKDSQILSDDETRHSECALIFQPPERRTAVSENGVATQCGRTGRRLR
jgi:hypothetical protein